MLKAKVDAGATRAMTQFFFENDRYFDYLDKVRARGIYIPIVPGILPVQNFKQMKGFAERCGTSVPRWLAERFDGLDDDVATRKLIAAAVAAEQVLDLVERGVTDFHFYTMNRADLVYAICHLLGCGRRCGSCFPLPWGEGARAKRGRVRGTVSRLPQQDDCGAIRPMSSASFGFDCATGARRLEIPRQVRSVVHRRFLLSRRLIIELDGGQHAERSAGYSEQRA